MKKKILKNRCILLFIITTIFISSFSINVFADKKISSISDSYFTEADDKEHKMRLNAYKIYSVFKELGHKDYTISGMLSNMEMEGSIDPTAVEGIYTDKYEMTDSKKKRADSHYSVAMGGKTGGTGIGLIQFSGGRHIKLRHYAEAKKIDWWVLDLQIMSLIHQGEDDGSASDAEKANMDSCNLNQVLKQIEDIVGKKTSDSAKAIESGIQFHDLVEKSADGADKVRQRGENSAKWLRIMSDWSPDKSYASDIAKGVSKLTGSGSSGNSITRENSLVEDNLGKTMIYNKNNGFTFDLDGSKSARQSSINNKRYKSYGNSSLTKAYSLYDLFGNDIHFIRYLGEKTVYINTLDHVYTQVKHGAKTSDIDIGDDVLFYDTDVYLSANVYKDRPKVLSDAEIKEGNFDPRVSARTLSMFNGGSYVMAEARLWIAKTTTAFVSFLFSDEIFTNISNVINEAFSSTTFKRLSPTIIAITILASIGVLISIIGIIFRFSKGVGGGLRELFNRVIIVFLCYALIWLFLAKPNVLNKLVVNTTNVINKIAFSTLESDSKSDDIVDNSSNPIEAMLFRKTIFNPWCKAIFNTDYEHCYTQFSEKAKDYKLNQSFTSDDVRATMDPGKPVYNSAKCTGDVSVKISEDKIIKNWAAYLYSCGSKYHIDYNVTSGESDINTSKFKEAKSNASQLVNADTYRVIDALMNISPEYYSDDSEVSDYTDSRELDFSYGSQSRLMIIYTIILLISMLPLLIKRIIAFVSLLISAIKLIKDSIFEIAKEGAGLKDGFIEIKNNVIKYLECDIKLLVILNLYYALVGDSFFQTILFIIITFVIYSIKPKDIKNNYHKIKGQIKHYTTKRKTQTI